MPDVALVTVRLLGFFALDLEHGEDDQELRSTESFQKTRTNISSAEALFVIILYSTMECCV
jgi:hypothetical protein